MSSQNPPHTWIPITPDSKEQRAVDVPGSSVAAMAAVASSDDHAPSQQIHIDAIQQQVEGKEELKKKKERKKRGHRGRIMLDAVFECTPKPTKPKKVVPVKKPQTKRKYTKRKLDKSSIVAVEEVFTVENLPVPEETPSSKLNEPVKRVLDLNLDCQLEVKDSRDSVSQACTPAKGTESSSREPGLARGCRASLQLRCRCCMCRIGKVKPAFPKEYKRVRTSSRIAKAKTRRLLPIRMSREDKIDFFKCPMALTHKFVPSINKRKGRKNRFIKEMEQPIEASLQLNDNLPGLNHSIIGENKKVTKTKKKQAKVIKETTNEKDAKVTRGRKKKAAKKPIWDENTPLEEMVDFITKNLEDLRIQVDLLALHASTQLEVIVDEETMQVWNMLKDRREDGADPVNEADEAKKKWWDEQRQALFEKAELFTMVMREFLGDRRFSPWKGSVVDSVVGVFLTQNVSDSLSSSAYMSLAARYPAKLPREDAQLCIECKSESNHQQRDNVEGEITSSEESMERTDSSSTPKQHMDPPERSNSTPKQHMDHPESSNSTPKQHMDPPESSNSTPKQHMDPPESSNSTPKQHMDPPESSNSTPKQHMDPPESSNSTPKQHMDPPEKQKTKNKGMGDNKINWDDLRTTYSRRKPRCPDTMDTVDWDAVRKADVNDIAKTIEKRGQNNILALKIKQFLDRIVEDHGSIDLEWLRDVPHEKAKEYLLSIHGLGLKSVECLRLLTLHHHAFPVDTNVGRIAVRLGWVPLQPLPDLVELHRLTNYPSMDQIQVYLWTRLRHLIQTALYELHYLMITFGKVFCTKVNPHCTACPLRNHCKYYASKLASSTLRLTGLNNQKGSKTASKKLTNPFDDVKPSSLVVAPLNNSHREPCVEVQNHEPIIDIPPSPEPEPEPVVERDIEDLFLEDPDEIVSIDLTNPNFMRESQENDMSRAIVTLSPRAASNAAPMLKYIAKSRTEHQVYELPDSHPLLKGLAKRGTDDPCPYLLAIWPSDESCSEITQDQETVPGTILIPCRTAMEGRFPLNGTYFQINEVFVDDETSKCPINVSRNLIWNLQNRTLYCGTSTTTILKGLSTDDIRQCFWRGFICIRAFNRTTREPKLLPSTFHQRPTGTPKKKAEED